MVAGRYGVEKILPVPVEQPIDPAESWLKIARDVVRAMLWFAGIDPTFYVIQVVRPERLIEHKRKIRYLTFRGQHSLRKFEKES